MNIERRQRHPLVVWAWSLLRLKFVGVAFGALFFCLSLTPSLLPRDWVFQGLIGGINAAFGYGLGVVIGKTTYRVVLRGARWWPPPARVLFWMKAAVVAIAPTACVLMLIPAASWQRQVSAADGHRGPDDPGLPAHADRRCRCRRAAGVHVPGAHRRRQAAGPDADQAMALARRGGAVHRHGYRCGAAGHVVQRCPGPRILRGGQRGLPAAGYRHSRWCCRNRCLAKSPAVQRRWRRGTRWDTRVATSSPPVRMQPNWPGSTAGPPRSPSGCMPGCTPHPTTRAGWPRAPRRTRAHRRVHPQITGHRADHRHRLDRPGGGELAGDDVQRRHRDRRSAVLLPAELDLVSGRPAEVHGFRPNADRHGSRTLATTAAGPPAEIDALRREPGFDGRPGRLRMAARHPPEWASTRCCGWVHRKPVRCGMR